MTSYDYVKTAILDPPSFISIFLSQEKRDQKTENDTKSSQMPIECQNLILHLRFREHGPVFGWTAIW